MKYGLSLFCELYRIFSYTVKNLNCSETLRSLLQSEMNLIIDSNFLCDELWQTAKVSQQFDFEQFLKLRKKRLSATIILFADCADWKFPALDEKTPRILQQIGYLIEIVSIVGHDLAKYKGFTEHNVFQYWLMMKNVQGGEEKTVKHAFLNEIRKVIAIKKGSSDVLGKKIAKEYRDLVETVAVLVNEYYRFEEVHGLKDEILGESRPKF